MKKKIFNSSGISMLEMMIVVVIAGLMAALASPSFYGSIQKMKFDGLGRVAINDLRLARSASVTLQQPHGVFFDTDHKRIVVFIDKVNPGNNLFENGDSVVRTDTLGVKYDYITASFANKTVMFQPNGQASETGSVVCTGSSSSGSTRTFTVSVVAGSGRSKLDYYN